MIDVSLNGILEQMLRNKIVLSAMQRPFVWREDRITKFVDSLLRNFPLGTAMIWRTDSLQRYRSFKNEVFSEAAFTTYFERNKSKELYLDGQQRLTSLRVAIHGTYDKKRLFIDVLSGERGEKDPGECYWDCRFLAEKEAEELNSHVIAGNNHTGDKRKLFIDSASKYIN